MVPVEFCLKEGASTEGITYDDYAVDDIHAAGLDHAHASYSTRSAYYPCEMGAYTRAPYDRDSITREGKYSRYLTKSGDS